jgi:hypothetical protein
MAVAPADRPLELWGTLQGLVPFSCAFRASGADRPEQRNQMLLSDFSGISLDGATWRSGYAAVCKTVYTSSILVVASTQINNLTTLSQVVLYASAVRQ